MYESDLFTTNRPPTDKERAWAEEAIASYPARLKSVQEKIAQLSSHLHSLTEERTPIIEETPHSFSGNISEAESQLQALCEVEKAILDMYTPLQRVLSPFRSLPDDIIREIFVACVNTKQSAADYNRSSVVLRYEAPLLLTQISSGTRQIALSTPSLWASIRIVIHPMIYSVHKMKSHLDATKIWINERSGSVPLTISCEIYSRSAPRDNDIDIEHEVVDILLGCSMRWRNMSLFRPPSALELSRIAVLKPSDIPLLRSLSITDHTGSVFGGSALFMAPRLQEIVLQCVINPLRLPVRWANLTYLKLQGPVLSQDRGSIGPIIQILKSATRLIGCRIDMASLEIDTDVEEIQLPFLKNLVLTHVAVSQMGANFHDSLRILEFIHAPELKDLMLLYMSFSARPDNIPNYFDILLPFIKRSPNLQKFTLDAPLPLPILIECLPHMSRLKELHVSPRHTSISQPSPIESHRFLHGYVSDEKQKRACPQLHVFHYQNTLDVTADTVRQFFMRNHGDHFDLDWKEASIYVPKDGPNIQRISDLEKEQIFGGRLRVKPFGRDTMKVSYGAACEDRISVHPYYL